MTYDYDVAVVGAGIAGICAAMSAARHGARTLLLCDRAVIGGNASSETGARIMGASHYGTNPSGYVKEGGLVEELRLRLLYYSAGGGYDKGTLADAVILDWVLSQDGIDLHTSESLFGCEKDGKRITKIHTRHTVSNAANEYTAKVFIDATGNGILAAAADCEYRHGREAAAEFNESLAPETADNGTMGASVLFETMNAGHPVRFHAPECALDITKLPFFKTLDDPKSFRALSVGGYHWCYELGGENDVLENYSQNDIMLRRLTYGIWDYIKNSGKYPKAENQVLKNVHTQSSLRESRRIVGDCTLTQSDIQSGAAPSDSVCIGGWPLDIHTPLGLMDEGPAASNVPVNGIYGIPYGCFIARDADNLMLAGRDISTTHIALGSTRIQSTCGAGGQAVGTAAALSVRHNVSLRDIGTNYMDELQRTLLEDDQTLPNGMGIHGDDRLFDAKASSTAAFENVDANAMLPLDSDYMLALMLGDGRLKNISVRVKNSGNTAVLRVKLLEGVRADTSLPIQLVGERCFDIEADFDGWVELPVDAPVGADGRAYIVFTQTDGLSLYVGEYRQTGAITYMMYNEAHHEKMDHRSYTLEPATGYLGYDCRDMAKANILFRGVSEAESSLYAPSNVLNGYTRPTTRPNIWRPHGELPQTLTLTAARPTVVSSLSITWDSFLDNDLLSELPPCLVRDYEIHLKPADGTQTHIISVSENYMRYNKHEFPPMTVSEISVKINETYGGVPGIYGISVNGILN